MYTNKTVKGTNTSFYPMGVNKKEAIIPCTQIANNYSSEQIVKNNEADATFFRNLEQHGIKLNQKQIEAVRSVEGPVITIAGAGSGKTSVLTSRVAYMMTEKQIHPGNIMLLTFTKKAAEEMKERISSLPGLSETAVRQLLAGTFHSIFLRVLRNQGINEKILSNEKYKQIIIKKILKELGLSASYEPETIISMIGYFKNHMILPNDLPNKTPIDKEIRDIYSMYEQFKKKEHLIDFDDILVIMYELLTTNMKLKSLIQNKIKYVLIDEFQVRP
ncbi:UvrD-helicase domain-containing protein [Bacillus cytotoxicus]|uniref:UvrD-helicase domain-containing protein n=1 Tax=Bacillus cytotoxicus TaxID=580165 RepID=UPI003D7D7B12